MKYAHVLRMATLIFWVCSSAVGQTQLPRPLCDLRPVSIPAVLATLPSPVTSMDLLGVRDFHGLSISPDGKYIAFVLGQAVYETNSYRTGLFVVGTKPGSAAISLGTAGCPHWDDIGQWGSSSPPQWSPDSRSIIYRARLHAHDTWQVWRWSLSQGRAQQWSHVPGNVISYRWLQDGRKLLLTLEKSPPASREREISQRGILYDGSIQPYRGRSVVSEWLAAKPQQTELWLHDLASGKERRVSREESPWNPAPVQFAGDKSHTLPVDSATAPDRSSVAYRVYDTESATYKLYVQSAGSSSPTDPKLSFFYIGEYWWSADSKAIYFSVQDAEGHSPTLMVAPAAGGEPRESFRARGAVVTRFSPDRSGLHLACTREDSLTPPQLAFLDLTSQTVRTLVDVNPEFKNRVFSPATRLEGSNSYGDAWYGYLLKPLGAMRGQKYPLIITTYTSSDGFLRGASGNEYPLQVFAAHGFAVFNINFARPVTAHSFQQALRIWASPLDSIKAAVRQLEESGVIDPDRIGITGFSHGAEILEYAISHSDVFHAAIASSSAARDPFFYYMGDRVWISQFGDWGLGGWPEGEARERWRQLAASLNADHVTSPLLINAADSEFLASMALYTSLTQLKKPVELFIYPDELHVKNQPRHRYEIYQRNVDWFDYWLQGKEDPNPEKAHQYARWRRLRDVLPPRDYSFEPGSNPR